MAKLSAEQQETLEALKEDVIAPAVIKGWRTTERLGVNKSFAYCDLEHDLEEGRLQVFLAVDPDARDDKFIYDSVIITGPQARDVLRNPGLEPGDDGYDAGDDDEQPQDDDESAPVPPTSAAHQHVHVVPPTEDSSAAHQDIVPPTRTISAAHQREVLSDPQGTYSQQDVLGIVKTNVDNMRSEFSELTNEELLVRVDGREVRWFNAFAKRPESATVKAAAASAQHPPRITGYVTDDGTDLRILHFIELGAGFRSLAIGRLTAIS